MFKGKFGNIAHFIGWIIGLSCIQCKSSFFQDIERCRFTQIGMEYVGHQNFTESGRICESWNTINMNIFGIRNLPLHLNKLNFCRNPTGFSNGPWCFINSSKGTWEYCNISFCHRDVYNCKDTDYDFEYSGKENLSNSGRFYPCGNYLNLSNFKSNKKKLFQNDNYRDLCSTELSQQEYFGKYNLLKEIQNFTKVIHLKKLIDYVTVIMNVRKDVLSQDILRKIFVMSTDYNYRCQKDIEQYEMCQIIKEFRVKSQLRLIFVCKNPLKTIFVVSQLPKTGYQLKLILGPIHRIRNQINPDIYHYSKQFSERKKSEIGGIPLLKHTGYFILLLENSSPYVISENKEVMIAISKIGKGTIGFVGNENYLKSNYQNLLQDFFRLISDSKTVNIIEIDELSIANLHELVELNQTSNLLALWNPREDNNEIFSEDILALVYRGLKLVIGISPWLHDSGTRLLETSFLKSIFIAGGLWPSLKLIKDSVMTVKHFDYNLLPLSYLLDYAIVGIKEMNLVADMIVSKLQELPLTDVAFQQIQDKLKIKVWRLFKVFNHLTRANVPCLEMPLFQIKRFKRNLIKLMNFILLYPMGNIFVAPGISFYPGSINQRVKPISSFDVNLNMEFSNEVIYLGIYLPPGHETRVTSEIAKANFCELSINYHLFDVLDQKNWYKWPNTKIKFKLYSGETRSISFAFGGLLSISCTEDKERVHLRFLDVIIVPIFDSRNSLISKHWLEKKDEGSPWVILANDVAVFILPSISLRNLNDPFPVMDIWSFLFKHEFHLVGRNVTQYHRELISADFQTYGGYMHSGYPIGSLIQSVANPRNRNEYFLASNNICEHGRWGMLHEIGHNLQDILFTFKGSEEVTNNIFTLAAMESISGNNSWSLKNYWIDEKLLKSFVEYIKNGDFNNWKSNPSLALGIYAQLKSCFGWEFYRQILRKYKKLNKMPLLYNQTVSDDEKIQLWIWETSNLTKMNLYPLYEMWRFPVYPKLKVKLNIYPSFLPLDFLTEMINKTANEIIIKYGGEKLVSRTPKKLKTFIGPLTYTSRIEGKSAIRHFKVF